MGTDEHGSVDVFDFDFTQPTLLLIGNETSGSERRVEGGRGPAGADPDHRLSQLTQRGQRGDGVLYEVSRQRSRR